MQPMESDQATLQQAWQAFEVGRLSDAEQECLEQLGRFPENADVLHLLGLIVFRNGKAEQGLELIGQAIGANPTNAAFQMSRAVVLQALGRFYEALSCYEHVLEFEPENRNALLNKARLLQRFLQFEEATQCYRQLIALNRTDAEAWSLLCNALISLGRLDEALAHYDRLLDFIPGNASGWYNRGNLLHQLNRHQEALASYARSLDIAPQYPDAWYNRGNILNELQRYEEALGCFEQTVHLDPGYLTGWLNRGNSELSLARPKEAIACFEQAIEKKPDYAEAWMNRGTAFTALLDPEEALRSYDRALEIRPGYAEAWYNRGNTLCEKAHHDLAAQSYRRAIALRPVYPEANLNLALLMLRLGNFHDGWKQHESRWLLPEMRAAIREFGRPLWLGDAPVAGRRILLHAEQGLGDTIQFCRYASEVASLGATVILEVQPPLVPLLKLLDGVSHIVAAGDPLPPFDLHCPLLSLPLAFGSFTKHLPSGEPYLSVNEKKQNAWKQYLGKKVRPRIGLVWCGNTKHVGDKRRSIDAVEFFRHLPQEMDYVCLQKELRPSDEDAVRHSGVLHCCEQLHDFSDTAALCSLMDLVISVDTSVAHLSAALGVPTWIMLPFVPDFRWLLDREDSPWYDSVTLFRQLSLGEWKSVIERVVAELASRFSSK
jgi:tetratricopeptide (TPR) repeat protein